jgi:hypothetical protein
VKRHPSGERTISLDLSSYPATSREKLIAYLRSEQISYWIAPDGHLELLRAYHPYEIQELVKLFSAILNE